VAPFYLDVLLRNQLASQIAPVLSRMNNAVNITPDIFSRNTALNHQIPKRMAKATGRDKEARSQRFARTIARVLKIQTASMVAGQRRMKAKALPSITAPTSFPVVVMPTPNQTRLRRTDPRANASNARAVESNCPMRKGLRLFAAWNVNG
jgi:hypothetical protein